MPQARGQDDVFLQDIQEWPLMNAIYAEYFPEEPPARSAVQVAALPMAARMEIEVVAVACDCNDGECDGSPGAKRSGGATASPRAAGAPASGRRRPRPGRTSRRRIQLGRDDDLATLDLLDLGPHGQWPLERVGLK